MQLQYRLGGGAHHRNLPPPPKNNNFQLCTELNDVRLHDMLSRIENLKGVGLLRRQPHRHSGLATLPFVGAIPQSPHIIINQGICCVLCLLCLIIIYFALSVYCVFLQQAYFDTVGWVFWPYNLYCVGGDVKHCSIQSNRELKTERNSNQSH